LRQHSKQFLVKNSEEVTTHVDTNNIAEEEETPAVDSKPVKKSAKKAPQKKDIKPKEASSRQVKTSGSSSQKKRKLKAEDDGTYNEIE
jgi:hypothetical protein